MSVYAASNSNKRVCPCRTDWNKYYIQLSDTPNFTTLEDYRCKSLHRRWNIPSGTIELTQEVTNAVHLSWRKYITAVDLRTYADGSVDQKWQFDGTTIILKIFANGAVHQMWNLRQKWFCYEREANGATIREGTATTQDVAEYEREIDLWCQANRRFFPAAYCVIYNRI